MLLTLINCELWTAPYFVRRAVVGLLDNSLLSFPDLFQPLPWALLKLSVSLPTTSLQRASLPILPNILSVSLPTLPLYVGLRRQFHATCPSSPQLKQLKTVFTLTGENLFNSMHLLAACPSRLHLLHLKGGPLAVEGDLSFAERIALSSSSDNSIAWDRRIDSSASNNSLDAFVRQALYETGLP